MATTKRVIRGGNSDWNGTRFVNDELSAVVFPDANAAAAALRSMTTEQRTFYSNGYYVRAVSDFVMVAPRSASTIRAARDRVARIRAQAERLGVGIDCYADGSRVNVAFTDCDGPWRTLLSPERAARAMEALPDNTSFDGVVAALQCEHIPTDVWDGR